MKNIFTIEDYRNLVRQNYSTESSPLVKGYWLKVGVSINKMLDLNKYMLIDEATEEFEKELFKFINERNEK